MAAFQSTKGHILIISGPSGVGKGTIIAEIKRRQPSIGLAISATTRSPRAGEANGLAYHFLSEAEFDTHIEQGDFLEWCQVHTHKYGTLKSEVLRYTEAGNNVILEIDVQGARKVKAQCPEAVRVFIMPPDMDALRDRLRLRDTDDPQVIQKRLIVAQTEVEAAPEYDFVFMNHHGHVDDVVQKILALLPEHSK